MKAKHVSVRINVGSSTTGFCFTTTNHPYMPPPPQHYPSHTPLPECNSHPPHPIEHPLLGDRGRDGLRRHSRSILQREREREGERGREAGRREGEEGGREKVKERGREEEREERKGGQNAEWLRSYSGSSWGWSRSFETSIFVNCIVAPKINPSVQLSTLPSLSKCSALILLSLQITVRTSSLCLIFPHSKES